MRAAAKLFVGRHDFKSFAGTRSYEMKSNVRTLMRCDIKKSGAQLTFIIEGDGFLYKMCRGIVGTLVSSWTGKNSAGARGRHSGQPRPSGGGHDCAREWIGAVESIL